MEAHCIFCSIGTGSIPTQMIAQNDQVFVIQDISPKSTYHYLIIPRIHYQDLQAVDEQTLQALMSMAQTLSRENSHLSDYRLVINNGYKAGQRVLHLHVHFLAGSSLSEF